MENRQNKKKVSTRVLAGVGMLSAVAAVLQYLEIPIFLMPSFIKFDFSDLPAYLVQVPLVIAICVGITFLFRKMCPKLARIAFGGR